MVIVFLAAVPAQSVGSFGSALRVSEGHVVGSCVGGACDRLSVYVR